MIGFDDYQKMAHSTYVFTGVNVTVDATPPLVLRSAEYVEPALGLGGEAGEVLEVVKKLIRNKNGEVDYETRQRMASELGDVLWYVAELATQFDLSLHDIAQGNLDKVADRQARGVIRGDGDNR